jgi:hypothetical protein
MPKFRYNNPNTHQRDELNIDEVKSILQMNKIFNPKKQQPQNNKHKFYCADTTNELSVILYFPKPDFNTYYNRYRNLPKIEKYMIYKWHNAKNGFLIYLGVLL